jgi:hypothetical protein
MVNITLVVVPAGFTSQLTIHKINKVYNMYTNSMQIFLSLGKTNKAKFSISSDTVLTQNLK